MLPSPMATVLVPLAPGFEEIEAVTPVDLLRRAGATVTLVSLTPELAVTGRSGLVLRADTTLDAVTGMSFDLVLLPGGPGVRHLRADPRVINWARVQACSDRWLAAICAAPTVLHDAGLLRGRRFTAHFSVASELGNLAPEPVVVDGHLVTSRGAGTALEFGLTLVELLFSAERSHEISHAIAR